MEVISSKSNEKIKYAVKLRESASFRKKEEKFFLESARLIKDAALSGAEIEMLFVTEDANEKYREYIEVILNLIYPRYTMLKLKVHTLIYILKKITRTQLQQIFAVNLKTYQLRL